MEAYLYEEMFRLEQRHWWFAAKHRIVLAMLERYLREKSHARVADVGCGCGHMLQMLSERYDAVGVDASPLAADFARQRGVKVVQGALPENVGLPAGEFDAAIMLDVMEHLDDDVASARAVSTLLKPDGILLVTVPAYQWLFSEHDKAHHHRRRYNRQGLLQVLSAAGLRVRYISYYNTILFPLAVGQRVISRSGVGVKQVTTAPPPEPINALFRGIFASERHALGRVSLPFGLSLIAVAERVGKESID